MIEPTLHGVVYTRNPFTGVKTSVCIISNATTQPRSLLATAAQFEVDIRTWNIVSRPQRNYTTALTDSQVIALARMAYAIKTQHLEHKCIHWDMVRGNPVVSHIEDFDVTLQLPTFQKTITQLYISAGNPHRVQDYKELPISGIGYLKSEYTLLQHGMHPLALLRSGKKKHIQNSITQTLQTFEPLHQVHHIVYKSFDVPSSELAQFKHATTYEPTETTPWLGARGAYKHLQQPELLVTELEAVNAFAATTQKHISFLLPFVRSATELHRLNTLCSKHIRTQHFSLWAQLATPEPFLNPGAYPFAAIKGISIQLDTLVQLLLGVAPASEVTQQYHLESTVLKTILQPFMSYMKLQHPQVAIHIQMEHYTRSYAELAISLGCTALTVRPAVAPLAKACIIDTEAAPFLSTHTRITTI